MINIIYSFFLIFYMFLIYAFLGWLIEVLSAFINDHKFINRGFLMGPIVPIWGAGALLISLFVKPDDSFFSIVVSSAFIGTFLEYVVNYLMEKIFKARWWDYSHLPFNIEGRVWLGSSMLFGIGGLCVIKFFNPFFNEILININKNIFLVVGFILFVATVVDFCISCNIIKNLNLSAYSLRKDYTEEVTKKVKIALKEKSHSFSRLLKAFPDVRFYFKKNK